MTILPPPPADHQWGRNDFTADLEQELSNVGTEANYRVPIEIVGPWLIVLTRKGLFT